MKKIILLILLTLAFIIFVLYPIKNVITTQSAKQDESTSSSEVELVNGTEDKEEPKQVNETPEMGTGLASWYEKGHTTASGEAFDPNKFTMACIDIFPLGTNFELCVDSKCTTAICNDRGNFERLGRTFDFSRSLFAFFCPLSKGTLEVQWRVIK